MQKKKINIGFDIGVTSVGWSIMDEDNKILNMGVRLFDDPANAKDGTLGNAKRREARSLRRRLRRTKTRKDAFANFLIKNKWVADQDELADLINIDITEFNVNNPIELKMKALKEKVNKEELIYILFHYIQHRGFFYVTEEMLKPEYLEKEKELPTPKIYEFYKQNGYYKNAEMNSNISAKSYSNEIAIMLEKQDIDKSFSDAYLEIFNSHRDFATGPGSEKSPTKYGLYREEKGKVVCVGNNLWDVTIGKCTYLPNELRGIKSSPIAIIFNLINDLNNIYFFNDSNLRITENVLKDIFNGINNKLTKSISLKTIMNSYNKFNDENKISVDDIFGYRIDKSKKAEFTKLDNYCEIIKWMKLNKIIEDDINIFDINIIKKANNIFESMATTQDVIRRLEILSEKFPQSNIDSNQHLCSVVKSLSSTHSLSYLAMLDFIKNCMFSNLNQMQYFNEKYGQKQNEKFANHKYITSNIYDDEIISPTARRAFNQNVKVMNKIIKFYSDQYDINNITFELARDKNTQQESKNINDSQKRNKDEIDTIIKNYDLSNYKINGKIRLRLVLWNEQNGIDLYDGKQIDIKDVLSGHAMDVDHIIPYSISNMDGRVNKVLTKTYLNKEKDNKTPYQWLQSTGRYEAYKDRVHKNIINKKKIENLLYENDPLTEFSGFIDRNLTDTRYASKVVLNTFQDFFRQNKDRYPFAKIKVINGSITNYARYNLFGIPKVREIYEHHAVDATIVNYLGNNHNINRLLTNTRDDENYLIRNSNKRFTKNKDNKTIIDNLTGEVINLFDTFEYSENIELIKEQIYDFSAANKIKFSRQLVQKNNVQLSNETIYSFKWKNENEGYIINKFKLIDKNTSLKDLEVYFNKEMLDKEKLEKLLVYKNDKKLYDMLFDIYNRYYDGKINPFINYMKDQYKIENPKFIQIESIRVNVLRLIGQEKSTDNILILKNSNSNAIMQSLNVLSSRIYKNTKEKLVIIPVNQKCLIYKNNKLNIDNIALEKILIKNEISKFNNFITINNGTILVNKMSNKLYYLNGGGNFKENKLDIKALFADNLAKINNETVFPRKQMQVALKSISENYDIAEVDELGNIYNRRKIML